MLKEKKQDLQGVVFVINVWEVQATVKNATVTFISNVFLIERSRKKQIIIRMTMIITVKHMNMNMKKIFLMKLKNTILAFLI